MQLHNRLLSVGCISSALVGGSLLHPVVSGQVKATTHQGAPIGQGLVPAAGLFVGLALLLGLVAFRAHIPTVDRVVSSTTTKRVATVAVVGLVVTTAALSGMGGPASPVETVQAGYFENCEFSDSLTFAVGASLGLSGQDCAFWTPDDQAENLGGTDALAMAESTKYNQESYTTTVDNFNQDVYSVMMAKAKISMINDLNNNVSEANATDNAKAEVREYASTQMKQLINQHNADVSQIGYLTGTPATVQWYDSSGPASNTIQDNSTETWTVSLPDGENVTYSVPLFEPTNEFSYIRHDFYAAYGVDRISGPSSGGNTFQSDGDYYTVSYNGTTVKVYDSTQHPTYKDLVVNIGSRLQQSEDNIDVLVNNTYQAYNAGEIDSKELAMADPTTIATQASTDYNSTGYYGYSNAQLAAMGLSGDTNASHVVSLDETNRTVTGTLFYTGENNQSFVTGQQYNPEDLDGSVYLTVSELKENGTVVNETPQFLYVEENFTVVEATNTQTGESLNETTMQTRNYTSTNVSDLEAELQQLREQRDYYEQQASAAGGGFGIDFGGTGAGIGIALAAVVVLLAFTRD